MAFFSGCRTLTSDERVFLTGLYSTQVVLQKVLIYGPKSGNFDRRINSRLQWQLAYEKTKSQRYGLSSYYQGINQSKAIDLLKTRARVITIGNTVFYLTSDSDFYSSNIALGWPNPPIRNGIALLAHELVHVWQYQNRKLTGYSLTKVLAEHVKYPNPYNYNLLPGKDFLSYRFEQQGSIVEDFVILCYKTGVNNKFCRSRHATISPYFDIEEFVEGAKKLSVQ